jgi:Ni/Co efflux regulator RcnB
MKRLIPLLAAVLAAAGPLAAGGAAWAKDKHEGGWEQRGGPRGGRLERGEPRGYPREYPRERAYPRQRTYPREYGPPPGVRAPRPGGYLPPQARGGVLYDYGRYRLRPPPRGYSWVRIGPGFALVDEDGRIFDVIE